MKIPDFQACEMKKSFFTEERYDFFIKVAVAVMHITMSREVYIHYVNVKLREIFF
jgi:hypothetical protein